MRNDPRQENEILTDEQLREMVANKSFKRIMKKKLGDQYTPELYKEMVDALLEEEEDLSEEEKIKENVNIFKKYAQICWDNVVLLVRSAAALFAAVFAKQTVDAITKWASSFFASAGAAA